MSTYLLTGDVSRDEPRADARGYLLMNLGKMPAAEALEPHRRTKRRCASSSAALLAR
jgi:hypothetical protein